MVFRVSAAVRKRMLNTVLRFCSAIRAIGRGRVKTMWKQGTGRMQAACFSIHLCAAAPWQEGQWRLPQDFQTPCT